MASLFGALSLALLVGASACASAEPSPETSSSAVTAGAGGGSGGATGSGGQGGTTGSAGAPGFPDLPVLDAPAQKALDDATHLVAVVTDAWPSVPATLALYARSAGRWQRTLGPFDAVVGSKGLSWGLGLTEPPA